MSSLWMAGGFVLLGLGAAALLIMRSAEAPMPAIELREAASTPVHETWTTRAEPETVALRREFSQLNAEVVKLRRLAEQQVAEKGSQEAFPSHVKPRTPEERAEQEQKWHEHMAEMDARFQSESRDSGWSETTSRAIRDTLEANEDMRASVRSIECRSRMCKIELLDDDSGAVAKHLPVFVLQLGSMLTTTEVDYVDQGGGRRLTTMLMTRSATP